METLGGKDARNGEGKGAEKDEHSLEHTKAAVDAEKLSHGAIWRGG